MNTKRVVFKILIVLFVLICGALGAFDLYMRTTWDDNVFIKTNKHTGIIERYAHMFIANVRSDSIPEQYRKPIHIIERDGVFYWANNDNMPLYKAMNIDLE